MAGDGGDGVVQVALTRPQALTLAKAVAGLIQAKNVLGPGLATSVGVPGLDDHLEPALIALDKALTD